MAYVRLSFVWFLACESRALPRRLNRVMSIRIFPVFLSTRSASDRHRRPLLASIRPSSRRAKSCGQANNETRGSEETLPRPPPTLGSTIEDTHCTSVLALYLASFSDLCRAAMHSL